MSLALPTIPTVKRHAIVEYTKGKPNRRDLLPVPDSVTDIQDYLDRVYGALKFIAFAPAA